MKIPNISRPKKAGAIEKMKKLGSCQFIEGSIRWFSGMETSPGRTSQ
jgi:hypothetical protein